MNKFLVSKFWPPELECFFFGKSPIFGLGLMTYYDPCQDWSYKFLEYLFNCNFWIILKFPQNTFHIKYGS